VLIVAAVSCSDKNGPDFYNGTARLHVEINTIIPEDIEISPDLIPSSGDYSLTMEASDGKASRTWERLEDFEQGERYLAGRYELAATYGSFFNNDSYTTPCFEGTAEVDMAEGNDVSAVIEARMTSAVVNVTTSAAFRARLGEAEITIHPSGGTPFPFNATSGGNAFVNPGNVSLSITLDGPEDDDSGPVSLQLARNITTQPATVTKFTLDFDDTAQTLKLTTTTAGQPEITKSIVIGPDLFNGKGPKVETDTGEISICEHNTPDTPAIFTVSSGTPLSSVTLSIASQSLINQNFPKEIDLLNPTPTDATALQQAGITLPSFDNLPVNIDISPILSHLNFNAGQSNISHFSLSAVDILSRTNPPSTITVVTMPVDLTIESVSAAIIGVDLIDIILRAPDADPRRYLTLTGNDEPMEIIDVTPDKATGAYKIRARIPSGTSPVNLRIYYDGVLKGEYTVERISPEFSISVDPFACYALLKISPADPTLSSIIVENLNVWINDRMWPIYMRDSEKGIITVMQLDPTTSYNLSAGMTNSEHDATARATFITEKERQLPNNDFEDVKHAIEYKDMPSGGVYSQTFAEIFNWQNHTSFDLWTPSDWASTNAKTFCRASKHHNTWYMQPSVYSTTEAVSGDYAVLLTSTAFDTDGPEIQPYLQESTPFVTYSRNIPQIKYRAAGRLFLGTYTFNAATMQETYSQGIPFQSRPQSVNGFYRYIPSRANIDDYGTVTVEILGDINGLTTTIGTGSLEFHAATSYAAFNVPISYKHFGVKATSIRIMFSSSAAEPEITAETTTVKTWDDPATATSTGSRLWLDNIILSY